MSSVSNMPEVNNEWSARWVAAFVGVALIVALIGLGVLLTILGYSPITLIRQGLDGLFALSTTQTMWYVTRAAGIISYLLLWLSTVWGLAVSNKILDPVLHRAFTYDFHQFLSLLAIGFIFLHVGVLLADQYLPFSVAQILVPFAAPYRPVWVGLGTIGLYLTLLVSVTFYIRKWIGQKTFRVVHLVSYLAFIAVALHGLFAGTDSPLPTVQAMYLLTSLSVVFLTAYRIFVSAQAKRQRAALSDRA
jgi:methionine sulfoxide reductase heme-binding subunit